MSDHEYEEFSLAGYISLKEAANRLPSPKPGRRTHVNTVRRLIFKHKIPMLRRGHFYFVKWTDLVTALHCIETPGDMPNAPNPAIEAERERWRQRKLRELGIIR